MSPRVHHGVYSERDRLIRCLAPTLMRRYRLTRACAVLRLCEMSPEQRVSLARKVAGDRLRALHQQREKDRTIRHRKLATTVSQGKSHAELHPLGRRTARLERRGSLDITSDESGL